MNIACNFKRKNEFPFEAKCSTNKWYRFRGTNADRVKTQQTFKRQEAVYTSVDKFCESGRVQDFKVLRLAIFIYC